MVKIVEDKKPVEQKKDKPDSVVFGGLEWETTIPNLAQYPLDSMYSEINGDSPELFHYSDGYNGRANHEERLRKEGWERSPSPQEVSSLIIANLEEKLTPEQTQLANNIVNGFRYGTGIFFCHAVERIGDKLYVYEYVTGLKVPVTSDLASFFVGHVVKPRGNDWYKSLTVLDIAGFVDPPNIYLWEGNPRDSGTHVYLKDLNKQYPKIVEYFFTRRFEDLPAKLKERGAVHIPGKQNELCLLHTFPQYASYYGIINTGHPRGSLGVRPATNPNRVI